MILILFGRGVTITLMSLLLHQSLLLHTRKQHNRMKHTRQKNKIKYYLKLHFCHVTKLGMSKNSHSHSQSENSSQLSHRISAPDI